MNVRALTDKELLTWLDTVAVDLAEAAEAAPNSEWHEACFAAAVTFSQEASRRGIRRSVH